jgi:NlpC/P60 family putative phage cell wall peptidase
MSIRAAICAEALTWLGTPYHDLQALKGVGADCARFPLAVAQAVGLIPTSYAPPVYSPSWHLHQQGELYYRYLEEAGCQEVPWEARQPGDVVLFRFGHTASHAAILLEDGDIVHALSGKGVIRHGLVGTWLALHDRVYAFPGVR